MMWDIVDVAAAHGSIQFGRCKICGEFKIIDDRGICPTCRRHMSMSEVFK